jgi:hypothetical protein
MKPLLPLLVALCAFSAHARTICPNGQMVEGAVCTLCPNGQYVGGTVCVLLPNGSYVAGQTGVQPPARVQQPRPITEPARVDSTPFSNQLQSPLDMVPSPVEPRRDNSRYRNNDNQLYTQCPDGSTVQGRYCVMTSNGRYIGRY